MYCGFGHKDNGLEYLERMWDTGKDNTCKILNTSLQNLHIIGKVKVVKITLANYLCDNGYHYQICKVTEKTMKELGHTTFAKYIQDIRNIGNYLCLLKEIYGDARHCV